MNTNDILYESYKESVAHTNRGMFLGIVISAILYLVVNNVFINGGVSIPIVGITVNSKLMAVYCLWAVYFYCGLYASYYYYASLNIIDEIKCEEFKKAITFYPSINTAKGIHSLLVSPLYIGIWYVNAEQIQLVESKTLSVVIGSVIAMPYLIVLFNLPHARDKYISIRKTIRRELDETP